MDGSPIIEVSFDSIQLTTADDPRSWEFSWYTVDGVRKVHPSATGYTQLEVVGNASVPISQVALQVLTEHSSNGQIIKCQISSVISVQNCEQTVPLPS